jgi:D-alanine-D-alanine ligase
VKKVVILHNRISPEATIDDLDILEQVELVSNALAELGYQVITLPFMQDDPRIIGQLLDVKPVFVFNLVEPVNGPDKNAYIFAPALLDLMGVKYSGCSSQTGAVVMNKLVMKSMLIPSSVPTPEFISNVACTGFSTRASYILKPISECTSIGLDGNPVYQFDDVTHLRSTLQRKQNETGMEFFAERYVDGREFRVSMIGNQVRPEILPPIEVTFESFEQENKPKVYNFTGKWITDSFEFKHTHSETHFEPDDAALLNKLYQYGQCCWDIFKMRGYAAVDFRVDASGIPQVVDVNTNPCLTAHPGGLEEAARVGGLSFTQLIDRITQDIA